MPLEHRCADVCRQFYIWVDLWPVRKCLSGDSQKQHGADIQWECRGRSSEEVEAERQQFCQECEEMNAGGSIEWFKFPGTVCAKRL